MCSRVFYCTIFSLSLSPSLSLSLSVCLTLSLSHSLSLSFPTSLFLSLYLSISLSLSLSLFLSLHLFHTHTHTSDEQRFENGTGSRSNNEDDSWGLGILTNTGKHVLRFEVFNTRRNRAPLLCMSVCLTVCLSVRLSVYLSVFLSVCLSVCMSVDLSVYLSVCLSICLSICLSVTPDEQQKLSSVPRTLHVSNNKRVSSIWCGLFVGCERLCDLILHYIVFLLFHITRLHTTPLNSALLCCALLYSSEQHITSIQPP